MIIAQKTSNNLKNAINKPSMTAFDFEFGKIQKSTISFVIGQFEN
jgi:hypothetical protein